MPAGCEIPVNELTIGFKCLRVFEYTFANSGNKMCRKIVAGCERKKNEIVGDCTAIYLYIKNVPIIFE